MYALRNTRDAPAALTTSTSTTAAVPSPALAAYLCILPSNLLVIPMSSGDLRWRTNAGNPIRAAISSEMPDRKKLSTTGSRYFLRHCSWRTEASRRNLRWVMTLSPLLLARSLDLGTLRSLALRCSVILKRLSSSLLCRSFKQRATVPLIPHHRHHKRKPNSQTAKHTLLRQPPNLLQPGHLLRLLDSESTLLPLPLEYAIPVPLRDPEVVLQPVPLSLGQLPVAQLDVARKRGPRRQLGSAGFEDRLTLHPGVVHRCSGVVVRRESLLQVVRAPASVAQRENVDDVEAGFHGVREVTKEVNCRARYAASGFMRQHAWALLFSGQVTLRKSPVTGASTIQSRKGTIQSRKGTIHSRKSQPTQPPVPCVIMSPMMLLGFRKRTRAPVSRLPEITRADRPTLASRPYKSWTGYGATTTTTAAHVSMPYSPHTSNHTQTTNITTTHVFRCVLVELDVSDHVEVGIAHSDDKNGSNGEGYGGDNRGHKRWREHGRDVAQGVEMKIPSRTAQSRS
ncbi:hypothetical protein BC938DRAFT_471713 [Jimgerdemannia flammicorona]|uniref:Uncharacterized protein n=1 Tax=Jimgerdemannia flammicorona TaxID=994334 RepID=A0A433Q7K5_9FUNG|nr:hypothetical protein BC938DRAFT_471713 [Jimgerdemannia flammicorona]